MNSSSLRPRVGDGLVMTVAHRLTQRDRSILTMLYRHRVFTTDQLAETYFDNMNTARHRLTTLYKLRLVDRFQPLDHRYASLPYHYVLDELGATVVAAERGEDPDTSRWRADKALTIGKSQRLRHLVDVNGFFSALLAESRRREDCDLSLWWSERHCASQCDRIAQLDGLGVWEEADNRIVFCLEYDRSTETLERLEKKLTSDEDLQVASGLAYWICFYFGHPRREAGARRVLAQATVPVATAALGPTQRPHEAIWARSATRARGCGSPRWPPCGFRRSPRSASPKLRPTGAERPSSGDARNERHTPTHRILQSTAGVFARRSSTQSRPRVPCVPHFAVGVELRKLSIGDRGGRVVRRAQFHLGDIRGRDPDPHDCSTTESVGSLHSPAVGAREYGDK